MKDILKKKWTDIIEKYNNIYLVLLTLINFIIISCYFISSLLPNSNLIKIQEKVTENSYILTIICVILILLCMKRKWNIPTAINFLYLLTINNLLSNTSLEPFFGPIYNFLLDNKIVMAMILIFCFMILIIFFATLSAKGKNKDQNQIRDTDENNHHPKYQNGDIDTKKNKSYKEENDTEVKKNTIPQTTESKSNTKVTIFEQTKNTQLNQSEFIVFGVIIFIISSLFIGVLAVIISKPEIVADLVSSSNNDTKQKYLNFIFLFLLSISALSILVFMVLFLSKTIFSLYIQLPQIIEEIKGGNGNKELKIIFAVIAVPLISWISQNLKLDTILNFGSDPSFAGTLVVLLIAVLISYILVESLSGLFSNNTGSKLNSYQETINEIKSNIIKISINLIKSFLKILELIPAYVESLEYIITGEDTKSDNKKP